MAMDLGQYPSADGFLPDAEDISGDLLKDLDDIYMDQFNFDEIFADANVLGLPEVDPHPCEKSMGNQTLNDLLDAPTLPVPSFNFFKNDSCLKNPLPDIPSEQVNQFGIIKTSPIRSNHELMSQRDMTSPLVMPQVQECEFTNDVQELPPRKMHCESSQQIIIPFQTTDQPNLIYVAPQQIDAKKNIVPMQNFTSSPQAANTRDNIHGYENVDPPLPQLNTNIGTQKQQQFPLEHIQISPISSFQQNSPSSSSTKGSPQSMNDKKSSPIWNGNDSPKNLKQNPNTPCHKAVEQRYRSSINDKIRELREMLFGVGAKSNKSVVLKRAIDYIKFLKNANRRLQRENQILRKHLTMDKKLTIKDLISEGIALPGMEDFDTTERSTILGYPSPEPDITPAYIEDVYESPKSIDELITGNEIQLRMNERNQKTINKGSAALCLFMIVFFIFNPIGFVFRSFGGYEEVTLDDGTHLGRQILNVRSSSYDSGWIEFGFFWVFNIGMTSLVLLKLFVWDDPVMQFQHTELDRVRLRLERADSAIKSGDHALAGKSFHACLGLLRQPLTTSRIYFALVLMWNILSFLVIQTWFSSMISRKLTRCSEWGLRSASSAAEVYHKLNQLQLSGHVANAKVHSSLCAIKALRFSKIAGKDYLPERQLVDINICAALRIKHSMPCTLYFIPDFFLSKVLVGLRKKENLECVKWMSHPIGSRFMFREACTLPTKSGLWCSTDHSDSINVLAIVSKQFGLGMLKQAFLSLVKPGPHIPNGSITQSTSKEFSEPAHSKQSPATMEYIELATASFPIDGEEVDPVFKWWCDVAAVGAHWSTGDNDQAMALMAHVKNVPIELLSTTNPLPHAILSSMLCRQYYFELCDRQRDHKRCQLVLEKCEFASLNLKRSLVWTKPECGTLEMCIQLLACGWLLDVRTGIWQTVYCDSDVTQKAPNEILSGFEGDLNSMRQLAQVYRPAMTQVYLHEAMERIMAGACPTKTRQLLGRTLRKRHRSKRATEARQSEDAGPRERAVALVLACRHLPQPLLSVPGRRAEMLQEAANTFKNLGDERGMRDCHQMMLELAASGIGTVAA